MNTKTGKCEPNLKNLPAGTLTTPFAHVKIGFISAISLICWGLHSTLADTPAPPPINVLWIIVDDMGYGDLSSTGCTNYSTPNIDRLGREGVTMERAYVYPVCTPSRAAFLTGHSPQKYGLETALMPGYSAGLPSNSITAAKEFKTAGYRTALVGKWHLGDTPEAHPNAQGFDEFFGFLWGETGYYSHTKLVGAVNGIGGVNELDFYQNRTKSDVKGYTTDLYSSKAISFIRENQKNPFFLCLAYNAPHYTRNAPQEYLNMFTGPTQMYDAVMKALDDSVGRVLTELDRLGLDKTTLVIFSTDNGAQNDAGSNAPFSGLKGSLHEGAIRSPFMARLPGIIPSGHRCKQTFAAWDLLPTCLSLANVTTTTTFEGDNLRTIFTSPNAKNPEARCLRYTQKEKTLRAVIKQDWKLHYDENTGLTSLYDLANDITESKNLAAKNPEKVEELKADWNAWATTFSPSLGSW